MPDKETPVAWDVVSTTQMMDCRIFTVEQQHSRKVDGSKEVDFFVLRSKDWVNVIPITPDGHLVMVVQFRHGTNELSLETPGGILDDGEDAVAAAVRELREETGYSGRPRLLGSCAANSAFMTNRFSAVIMEDAVLTDQTAFDEHEELQIQLVPLAELPRLIQAGGVQNSHSVLSLSWYLLGYGPMG